jgi:predicted enzyme related to lactoylglutathione lyase
MSITNALASIAVRDIEAAARWYEALLEKPASRPMPEVAEWKFDRGGALQVYEAAERAGSGSCTLAVTDLDAQAARIAKLGVDTSDRTSSERVNTLMITDPDGNHIALAEASDPRLAH